MDKNLQYIKKNLNYNHIYKTTIIASIAHAIMVATYPELSYEHSWDGFNYNFNNGEGDKMTLSFINGICVGGIFSNDSGYIKNLDRYLTNAPQEIKKIFIEETSQYFLENIDGNVTPILSTVFWLEVDNINLIETYEDFQSNGGYVLESFSLDIEDFFSKCEEYYEMNLKQLKLLKSLSEKKLNKIKMMIPLTEQEISMIGGDKEYWYESKESFEEINIYMNI